MTGLVAGVGVKAALSAVPWRLVGFIGAGLAVAAFVLLAFHWKHQAADRKATLAVICQSTRDASGQPKLKCGDVPKQIQFMGQAIGTLTTALHKQSDAVAAMGAETVRQQKAAEDARKAAERRAGAAQSTVERLSASSRAPERQSKPCEPSKALEGAWR